MNSFMNRIGKKKKAYSSMKKNFIQSDITTLQGKDIALTIFEEFSFVYHPFLSQSIPCLALQLLARLATSFGFPISYMFGK